MNVRDLERLFTAHGVGAAKMDATTRKLRECGRLPVGGRGPNAPTIGFVEAATILVAVAGSAKGNEADARVGKLASLRCTSGDYVSWSLPEVLAQLLSDPATLHGLAEVRIARIKKRATIHFKDGRVEEFLDQKPDTRVDRFDVEGILPVALLDLIASAIRDEDRDASRKTTKRK